ncbi:FmdE family protein [Moorellaceae bacterium AZ2]
MVFYLPERSVFKAMHRSQSDWERAVEFHGHTCPGLAAGYRAAQIALRELKAERAQDEELVAVVETDACGVDAVQVLTGCTLGKGNLLYRDYGKHVFTFICRDSGRAVRIAVKASAWRQDEAYRELRKRVLSQEAGEEEKALFQHYQEERTRYILEAPEEEICTVRKLKLEPPPKARLFDSVICSVCGEPVAEVRARVREGRPVCIPCAEHYSRGWRGKNKET